VTEYDETKNRWRYKADYNGLNQREMEMGAAEAWGLTPATYRCLSLTERAEMEAFILLKRLKKVDYEYKQGQALEKATQQAQPSAEETAPSVVEDPRMSTRSAPIARKRGSHRSR
jgi:hypothetical protein